MTTQILTNDSATKTVNFEEAIAQLEAIIRQMENDEIALEVALSKYQEGVTLVKYCQSKLSQVEQEIKILDVDTDTLKDFSVE
ncbi:MAG: exodeoxyribonuclease VII small subunit [Burkholderiales bacterium]|nr:exodeoxyribonuclease VII small subunit [Burkholderiales bacterium]